MNKCPKCESEKLVENQKFCQICGFNLDMSNEEAIEQLEKIISDMRSFMFIGYEKFNDRAVQAIDLAIKALEKNAQEE